MFTIENVEIDLKNALMTPLGKRLLFLRTYVPPKV